MRFGSVCSGIEAASVAWEPLGWRADWVAEVEAFPSAVLAHHWPEVPNLGDMTRLPDMVANDNIAAPDVLVGGTPCQAFSVAGLRQSLDDARGQLTLSFVRLADEIDRRRAAAGLDPAVIVWENVPGVLSTKDNAFGCFLAGLVGEDQPLFPAGAKWSNAGYVSGPQRAAAWRILDAQFFGVAQRRRRVFVVASARDGFDPATVLFEFDGVRRDSAPRRETRQGPAADAGTGPAGCYWDGGQLTQTLDAVLHKGQTMPEKNRFPAVLQPQNDNAPAIPILEAGARTGVSTTDPRAGMGIGADGDPMFTLQAGKQHGVAAPVTMPTHDIVGTLCAEDSPHGARGLTGLQTMLSGYIQPVCATGDIAHTLKAEGFDGSEDGTGRGVPTIAQTVALRGRDGGATAELGGDVATALRASTGGGDKPHVLAFHPTQDPISSVEVTHALGTGSSSGQASAAVAHALAVRRLTPRECERLQGFPDDHTLVPHRNKPAADGPRYKALGNSMAVPVMRWIGERIDRALRAAAGNDN
jgi:DNA (cytosine-5)-methyltransferase 1